MRDDPNNGYDGDYWRDCKLSVGFLNAVVLSLFAVTDNYFQHSGHFQAPIMAKLHLGIYQLNLPLGLIDGS